MRDKLGREQEVLKNKFEENEIIFLEAKVETKKICASKRYFLKKI